MEMEEIVKILFVVLILALMVGIIVVLLSGKGGELLASIRDTLRFGR